MPYRPWEDAWLVLRLKRELAFTFLSTFFSNLYTETVQPLLKILLMEGNFYRRENLTEYTNVFTLLDKQQNNIDAFMSKISPEKLKVSGCFRYLICASQILMEL